MSSEFFNAIRQGDMAKVRLMIQSSPELVNAKDDNGMSAVTMAKYHGRDDMAELLVLNNAKMNIFEACAVGRIEQVKQLLKADSQTLNSYSQDGFTALHLAAFFGHLDIVKLLVDAGADVNSVAKNLMQVMPLHSAVARNQNAIVEFPIRNGADVNARQHGGFTALHAAAQSGNLEAAKLLLSHGANINTRTEDGRTALALTKQEGPETRNKKDRIKVAQFIVQGGGKE